MRREEAGDANRDVDSRTAQLTEIDCLQPASATRRPRLASRRVAPALGVSSPLVRIADVPQTERPTDCGYSPASSTCRRSRDSAIA